MSARSIDWLAVGVRTTRFVVRLPVTLWTG